MAKFGKPKFATLLKHYSTTPSSVHACKVIDPTQDSINTCAARMAEALVIANSLVKTRQDISKLGTGKGSGRKFLLGTFKYPKSAVLCPHGIARGAQDLGNFLKNEWGARTKGWQNLTDAPKEIKDKTGIVLFIDVQGFSGQGHIDLWNKTAIVGSAYWDADTVWFWELK